MNELDKYEGLLQQAYQLLEQLVGDSWTDHNVHDPGITILEYMCQALAEMQYRLNSPMVDILADNSLLASRTPVADDVHNEGNSESDKRPLWQRYQKVNNRPDYLFHTAEKILPARALTINDYRKLLLDIDGVRNAWLKPVVEKLSDDQGEVRGLYRIDIELNEPQGPNREKILTDVEIRFLQHRNLCEDLTEICCIERKPLAIEAVIHVEKNQRATSVHQHCLYALEDLLAPKVCFYTLAEMRMRNKRIEDLFNGPLLEHGFVEEMELQASDYRKRLGFEEIRRVLLAQEGVSHVNRLRCQDVKTRDGAIVLDDESIYQLDEFSSELILVQDGKSCTPNTDLAIQNLQQIRETEKKQLYNREDLLIELPRGEDKNLGKFESIQLKFPVLYGLQESYLPESAGPQRHAQAKQLRAYLLILEQFLADRASQIVHFRHLMSFDHIDQVGAAGWVEEAPSLQQLLKNPENFISHWSSLRESEQQFVTRRSLILNHLLARFSESVSFAEHLSIPTQRQAVQATEAFLQEYPQLSMNRMGAWNYRQNERSYSSFSGLQRRLCSDFFVLPSNHKIKHAELFQIEQKSNAADQILELRFYLKDKDGGLLLASKQHYFSEEELKADMDALIRQGNDPRNYRKGRFSSGTYQGKYSFQLLAENNQVLARPTRFYESGGSRDQAIAQCMLRLGGEQKHIPLYVVEHVLLRPECDKSELDSSQRQPENRFSFQVTIVLPRACPQLRPDKTETELAEAAYEHTPAHIKPKIIWLYGEAMKNFERIYFRYVEDVIQRSKNSLRSNQALLSFLETYQEES